MDLTLNGHPISVELREGASMLELLREACGLTSMKDGCAPEGSCGACTVIVDGRAVVSCAQPAARAASRTVTTQEGLEPAARHRWARAFVVAGASQCGFCSPGIVMKAGAMRFSDHPRARIVRIDTTRAAALPGVVAVTTWKDVPGERTQGAITKDWRQFVAEGEVTSYVGDMLAAVAAETRRAAREAAAL